MSKKKRLPRNRRVEAKARPPMRLTSRDIAIIRAVNEYRALTAQHIQDLFFGSSSTAQYRLVRLFQHGYLQRHFAPIATGGEVTTTPIYTLDRRGGDLLIDVLGDELADLRIPKKEFSWQFIEHLLTVNRVRVAIALAARREQWQLAVWQDERVFRSEPDYVVLETANGQPQEKPVLPDGYFCLATPRGRAHFFLEVDRGREAESKFKPQIAVYQQYTEKSSGYFERYHTRSLRILIVTPTKRRLSKLKAVTLKSGGDEKYWFTTLAQISPETVLTAAIWEHLTDTGLYTLISR